MLLSELLTHQLPTGYDRSITGLSLDSRTIQSGEVFIALAGTKTRGEIYIESALQRGAIAILKEASFTSIESLKGDIPCISQPNLSQQLGEIAARFYGYPSRDMSVIGVTGTNGKTSVTHIIAHLLHTHSPCGLLGTLGYGIYGALQGGLHTTPHAIRLQALLSQLKVQNVLQVVMEVSSHALVQGRVNGIHFETAVFTNLRRDHLDYHKTMTAYGQAKQQLFMLPHLKTAVINLDDAFGYLILSHLPKTVVPLTYSLCDKKADVYGQIRGYNTHGCQLDIDTRWGNEQVTSPLFGSFNVSNLLAALTVLLNKGFSLSQLLSQLTTLRAIPGRMERFGQVHQPTVIIDYAHTPDALEKALLALREHLGEGILWCVFGCGGDRDRGKRPLMGKVAQRYADRVILTDDNPRHETSQLIIDDILEGCPMPTAVIPDRQQAIRYTLEKAAINDVILIAGKGHEDYQQIGDQRLPFSDRSLVVSLMSQ